MSDQKPAKSINTGGILPQQGDNEIPCNEKNFFESFYEATVEGSSPVDRDTIGGSVTEPESRYHYNSVENAIIVAMARIKPLPPPMMIRGWTQLSKGAKKRLLDIGSGTGHWIDFFVDTYFVFEAVAVEITENMSTYLEDKYKDNNVRVLSADVASGAFTTELIGGQVDYISAIGVMFHITDDARLELALNNLTAALKDGGIMFIGGEFGERTQNVHFNKVDDFANWRDFRSAEGTTGEVRVNKRVRSLDLWTEITQRCGLKIVDLVRTHKDRNIAMPENDLLVLMKS